MQCHIFGVLRTERLSAGLCELQCGGIEAIWRGKPLPADVPEGLVIGYHLTFYPDWLDFYREDTKGLERKFGSLDAVRQFYGGFGRECLLAKYREDLSRAETACLLDAIHHAWCEPCIATVVRRIAPCYLTHELSAPGRTLCAEWVCRQTDVLKKGGVQNA